ncbi:MAG: translation initiation factor [Chlorobi bacterium]|nr:translation initiation factor [Chlorobiota bacterium]
MAKDWKERLGTVYSTNSDFEYEYDEFEEEETLAPEEQKLKVTLDNKKRKGKTVTLITGFVGREDDLKDLAKILKTKCGVGGTTKDNEIIIQGKFKDRIIEVLKSLGYNNVSSV